MKTITTFICILDNQTIGRAEGIFNKSPTLLLTKQPNTQHILMKGVFGRFNSNPKSEPIGIV